MRILAATTAIHPDGSSEGIASSRFLLALAHGGHDVRVVTRDRLPTHWPLATQCLPPGSAEPAAMGVGFPRRAVRNLAWRLTGYPPSFWSLIRAWRRSIAEALDHLQPDLLVTRGAGGNLEPHLAVLGLAERPLWLAHYHDPYPRSRHPEPYRLPGGMAARRQEALSRRILRSADLLSFPSERLRDWVLQEGDDAAAKKAIVLPHLLPEGPAPSPVAPSGDLTLVHTGTLLRQRAVKPLVEGLAGLLERVPEARGRVRLVQVGNVHPEHRNLAGWRALEENGVLVVRSERVPQSEALAVAAAAHVVVLLEADATLSPYFPVKLADYLALRRPILALSPRASVATDLLGGDYALRVAPGDAGGVAKALDAIWAGWQSGRLDHLVPEAACRASLTSEAMVERMERATEAWIGSDWRRATGVGQGSRDDTRAARCRA